MSNSTGTEAAEWEVRPSGMLVQRRDNHDHHDGSRDVHLTGDSSGHSIVKINVSLGPLQHEVFVPAHSTFGELKKEIALISGLNAEEQKVSFRGNEMEDNEHLDTADVKDNEKVLVLEDPTRNEKNVLEELTSEEKQFEEVKDSEEMLKALIAIDGVRAEIDRLSDRVAAVEVAVNNGTKLANEEFEMPAELLMRQLLKLDGIEAEGEARVQRKAEVRRVQNLHETLDILKARNSNPITNSDKTVSVTTEWTTFDSGVGSLTPPPPTSSPTKVTESWEQFD